MTEVTTLSVERDLLISLGPEFKKEIFNRRISKFFHWENKDLQNLIKDENSIITLDENIKMLVFMINQEFSWKDLSQIKNKENIRVLYFGDKSVTIGEEYIPSVLKDFKNLERIVVCTKINFEEKIRQSIENRNISFEIINAKLNFFPKTKFSCFFIEKKSDLKNVPKGTTMLSFNYFINNCNCEKEKHDYKNRNSENCTIVDWKDLNLIPYKNDITELFLNHDGVIHGNYSEIKKVIDSMPKLNTISICGYYTQDVDGLKKAIENKNIIIDFIY